MPLFLTLPFENGTKYMSSSAKQRLHWIRDLWNGYRSSPVKGKKIILHVTKKRQYISCCKRRAEEAGRVKGHFCCLNFHVKIWCGTQKFWEVFEHLLHSVALKHVQNTILASKSYAGTLAKAYQPQQPWFVGFPHFQLSALRYDSNGIVVCSVDQLRKANIEYIF